MDKEILDKWDQIFAYTAEICRMKPWSIFSEKDIAILVPKGKEECHYFSFIGQNSAETAIAIYADEYAYFTARARLYGSNPKREPVFLLQDAIIFQLGDRKDVSKVNYDILKSLNISCRGRGNWPFFQRYRVGYVPDDVPPEMLDTLLDDMGNLMMMVHAVVENHLEDQLGHGLVLLRFYDPERDLFCTHFADSMPLPRATLGTITVQDTPWLQKVRTMIPRGTVEIDWSYLPTTVKNGRDIIVPRLLLICNSHTGYILKCPLLPPSEEPFEDLMSVLQETIDEYGKPASIEICDDELEDDIADLCRKAKIRLVKKKRLRQTTLARKELLKDYQIIVDEELN